jgi:hypothetical protein
MRILCINAQKPKTTNYLDAFDDARDIVARFAEAPNVAVAACWRKLLELIDRLCELGPPIDLYGWITDYGYELTIYATRKSIINVRADRFDYGPCINGIPVFHYRVEVQDGSRIVRETRRESADEMASLILGELGYGTE